MSKLSWAWSLFAIPIYGLVIAPAESVAASLRKKVGGVLEIPSLPLPVFDPRTTPDLASLFPTLSAMEVRVLGGVCRGETSTVIGSAERVSEDAVKAHIRRLSDKLVKDGRRGRTGLMAEVIRMRGEKKI